MKNKLLVFFIINKRLGLVGLFVTITDNALGANVK